MSCVTRLFIDVLKKLITDGSLGEIADIDQTENVAYWHFALSYVRGPWRDMKESTPTIVAKCCHDLDILRWLMDKRCESVSSYGSRFYFNERHAPDGSATHASIASRARESFVLTTPIKCIPSAWKTAWSGERRD